MKLPATMTYSPVNHLLIDWGHSGVRFSECCLPQPKREHKTVSVEGCPCHTPKVIIPAINTYDWDRWLSEIIVGMDDPVEEIAADYSRQAAIEFCKYARVLQREITIPLQHGECTYSLPSVDFENIIGVIGAGIDDDRPCACSDGCRGYLPNGMPFYFDAASKEIHLEDNAHRPCQCNGTLRLLVYVAPTEDACVYDEFLYNNYRSEIVMKARREYARAVHFRDRYLMAAIPQQAEIDRAWTIARNKAGSKHSFDQLQYGSGLFGTCMARGYR